MNERIRQLAEQAGFKLIRENCYDIVSTMSVQEFAELIVLECADFIAETATIETLLGDRLKEHFGVE